MKRHCPVHGIARRWHVRAYADGGYDYICFEDDQTCRLPLRDVTDESPITTFFEDFKEEIA